MLLLEAVPGDLYGDGEAVHRGHVVLHEDVVHNVGRESRQHLCRCECIDHMVDGSHSEHACGEVELQACQSLCLSLG